MTCFDHWLYSNSLSSQSVENQEPARIMHFDPLQLYQASHGIGLDESNNVDIIETFQPMKLDMGQPMVTSERPEEIENSAAQTLRPSTSSSRLPRSAERGEYHDESFPSSARRRQTPYSLPSSRSRGASGSSSTSPPLRKRPQKIRRTVTHRSGPSRNRQATTDQVEEIQQLLYCSKSDRPEDLACPVTGCEYKQLNGRMPDFRRHVKTHLREDGTEIRCKGVPWLAFLGHRDLFPKIPEDDRPYTVPEEDGLWIGGCLKTFSRADALKRHLVSCLTDSLGLQL